MNLFGIHAFLSRGLYGKRPTMHFDAYRASEGYWFLEAGSFTLEVDHDPCAKLPVRPGSWQFWAIVTCLLYLTVWHDQGWPVDLAVTLIVVVYTAALATKLAHLKKQAALARAAQPLESRQ